MKHISMMSIRLLTAYGLLLTASCGLAANDAQKMGFNHLGAEFGAYEVDAQGGIKLGGVKKGGNRLGYPIGGAWKLAIDKQKVGVKEKWYETLPGNATITLPGTLDDAGIGEPGKPSVSILTREHEYIGMAWYQREIDIPESWKGKTVQMWMDRVMWESRLYVELSAICGRPNLRVSSCWICATIPDKGQPWSGCWTPSGIPRALSRQRPSGNSLRLP